MVSKTSREFKTSWIMTKVQTAAGSNLIVKENKLIAEFCIFHSCARRTCLEILKLLEDNDQIIREFDEVWTPEKYREQKILEKEDLDADKILEKLKSGKG